MMNKVKITGLLGGALLLCGTQAQAAITWTFDSSPNSGYVVVDSTKVTQTAGGVLATAQAWSNTNNGIAGTTAAALGSNTTAGSNNYTLETAYLSVYDGGIGVKNRDLSTSTSYGDLDENNAPEHATDNNQRYDSVLFNFNSAIDLNSVTIGYQGTDSDITVLAYTGTGSCVGSATCTSSVSGKTYANLANYGWSFIGHYTDLANNVAKSVNTGNVTSSYWLIGALNPLVNATTISSGNDYVKLLALSGDKYSPPPPPSRGVPEPGTLLLMGAGLFGLTRIRAQRVVRSAA